MHYIEEAWRKSNQMLATQRPCEEPTLEAEDALRQNRRVVLKAPYEMPAPAQQEAAKVV